MMASVFGGGPFHCPLTSHGGSIYVANFAQEAMKGQWPLSVWQLCAERGELFGHGEALLNSIFKLSFAQHVHQLDAG